MNMGIIGNVNKIIIPDSKSFFKITNPTSIGTTITRPS